MSINTWLFPEGDEPDPQFSLANEQTFLAWTRTALAFLATGIAIQALPISGVSQWLRTSGSVIAICLGMIIALNAAWRWVRVQRALRLNKPLPLPVFVPVLAAITAVVCGIVLVSYLR